MKKNVSSRDLKKVGVIAGGLMELGSLKSRHFITKDRKLLDKGFKSYERKLQRIINVDINLIHKNIAEISGSKLKRQKLVGVVDEVLKELNEKSRLLARQTKIISEAKKRVSRKKAAIEKKIKSLNKNLKDEGKKETFLKKKRAS